MTPAPSNLRMIEPAIDVSPEWRHHGACRDLDPELWFADNDHDRDHAAAVCKGCPVSLTCLRWAIATDQQEGIWGGQWFPLGPKQPCGHLLKHKTGDTGHTYRDCKVCNAAYHRDRRDRIRMDEAARREEAVA